MARDCIVLLAYVCKHPDDHQTFQGLANATGIPMQTVWAIIRYARLEGEASMLGKVAKKYGYCYRVFADVDKRGRRCPGGRIIDVMRSSDWALQRVEAKSDGADSPSIDCEDLNEP